jgi:hypothetical protein
MKDGFQTRAGESALMRPHLTFEVEGDNFHFPNSQRAGVIQAPNLRLKTLKSDGQQYAFSYYGNNLAPTMQTLEVLRSVWNLTV